MVKRDLLQISQVNFLAGCNSLCVFRVPCVDMGLTEVSQGEVVLGLHRCVPRFLHLLLQFGHFSGLLCFLVSSVSLLSQPLEIFSCNQNKLLPYLKSTIIS